MSVCMQISGCVKALIDLILSPLPKQSLFAVFVVDVYGSLHELSRPSLRYVYSHAFTYGPIPEQGWKEGILYKEISHPFLNMPRSDKATPQEKKLCAALRKELYSEYKEGVLEVLPQFWDGHKTVDIRIVLYDDDDEEVGGFDIEVDGSQHASSKQLLSDIDRAHYSHEEGFDTLRIPNWNVDNKLKDTVSAIAQAVRRDLDDIYGDKDEW